MQIQIEDVFIGDDYPCFIIAEAGVNHNGDINKAKHLIDIAKESGANAVKFQTWITEELITKAVRQAEYQEKNTGITESQYDMLKKLELNFEQFKELKEYADKKGIMFLSTPDDEKSVDFLYNLDIPAFKIGSGELTNIFLLKRVAEKEKPIILSTGMANLEEINTALDIIYASGNKDVILLHCTSQYPTKYKDVNLRAMLTLKKKYNLLVGYSDHSLGSIVSHCAVSLGACVLEKHFTYDKNAIGPDHLCSLNPEDLKNYVSEIRLVEKILGKYEKTPSKEESQIRKIVRKTIVAKEKIMKGTTITEDLLTVKRSDGTIEPKDLYNFIGKVCIVDLEKDQAIKPEFFKNV